MLLDDAGAERDRGDRDGDRPRVIRQADRHAPALGHGRDRPQVDRLGRRRVGARALEQRDLGGPPSRAAATASSISSSVAMPVDMIIGRPVRATAG